MSQDHPGSPTVAGNRPGIVPAPETAEGLVRRLGMSADWDAMEALLVQLEELPDVDDAPASAAPGTTDTRGRASC